MLGSQLLIVGGQVGAARLLWLAGIVLWVVLMYAFFTAVVVRDQKPSLEAGLNGGWLLSIVATQAVSVLGTLLSSGLPGSRDGILFFTLCLYLLGAMLYLMIITLIFYRFTFMPLSMQQLTPPYWINMGAVAITTLAGSSLLLQDDTWPLMAAVAAVPDRLHAVLLGGRDLVDSAPDPARRVAARRSTLSAAVRPAVLGHGVPHRHVHRVHLPVGAGDGARLPDQRSGSHRVRRPGRMGGHLRRSVAIAGVVPG